jgi:O-antigen/teichoic acid export membrane protein
VKAWIQAKLMIKEVAKLFSANKFFRNVTILASGTIFSQVIMALALPILTRLYTPENFNLLAVYTSLISIFTVSACMRFNIAIPLPKQDTDAAALMWLAFISASVFSGILGILIIFFSENILELLNQESFQDYLWMLPIGVFFAALYDATQFWSSRKKRFSLITKTRIIRAVSGASTQLGFGAIQSSPFGLLLGHMLYSGLGSLGLIRIIWQKERGLLLNVKLTQLRAMGHSYRRYPYASVPESIFNTIGSELPTILIASATLGSEAGFLMLATRVMGLPIGFIGSSIGQVYLAEAPEHLRQNSLVDFTRKTMKKLLLIGTPPILLAGILSPFFFPFIFGDEWGRSGVIMAWLTPYFILQFIVSPISMVLHISNNIELAMWLQLVGMILRVGAVFFAVTFLPGLETEIFAVSSAFFYTLFIVVILRKLKSQEQL